MQKSLLILAAFVGWFSIKPSTTINHNFNLSSLPLEWVHLTDTDSGMVVYNTCDGGNSLVTILKNTNGWGILLHGQQEDYEFDVLEAYLSENDTLLIKVKWKDANEFHDFKFLWIDKDEGLGRWFFFNPIGFTYVTAHRQVRYKKVEQPCRECWDDECDEIEKLHKP